MLAADERYLRLGRCAQRNQLLGVRREYSNGQINRSRE